MSIESTVVRSNIFKDSRNAQRYPADVLKADVCLCIFLIPYVNVVYKDDTDLGKLMHEFSGIRSDTPFLCGRHTYWKICRKVTKIYGSILKGNMLLCGMIFDNKNENRRQECILI